MARRPIPSPDVPRERLEAYDHLIGLQPGLERKGASLPYTSINGHMTSFVDASGIALRLAPPDRDAFIAAYTSSLHTAHGATMREYVTIPDAALADVTGLIDWFARSVAYVGSLKPKPARRARP
jgi:hypothetical protein